MAAANGGRRRGGGCDAACHGAAAAGLRTAAGTGGAGLRSSDITDRARAPQHCCMACCMLYRAACPAARKAHRPRTGPACWRPPERGPARQPAGAMRQHQLGRRGAERETQQPLPARSAPPAPAKDLRTSSKGTHQREAQGNGCTAGGSVGQRGFMTAQLQRWRAAQACAAQARAPRSARP